MKIRTSSFVLFACFACMAMPAKLVAQEKSGQPVPRLVRFGGVLKDVNRKPLTGTFGLTFDI